MKRVISGLLVMFVVVAGCATPQGQVRTVDDRPLLGIQGAPEGAELYVDGINMGRVDLFDGDETALRLEPGTHRIEVKSQGGVLHSESVYLGSGTTKVVTVSGGH